MRRAPFTGASYHPCLAAGASYCGAPRVRVMLTVDPVLACVITEPLMWGRASALQIGTREQA